MKALMTSYGEIIFTQRHWSWAIAAILFVILGLWIRSLFLRPLIRRVKSIDRKHNQELKKVYLKRSLMGWILFFLSLGLFIALWIRGLSLPLESNQIIALIVMAIFYGLSVLQHVTALGVASIQVLKGILGIKDEI